MRIDLRWVEVDHDLWALGHMLDVLEPTIAGLADQYQKERFAELERGGWADDEVEVDLALQESGDMREYVLPRFLRGPIVVSIAACLESGVNTVANRLGRQMRVRKTIQHRPRDSFLSAATRHFDEILHLPLDVDRARLERLGDLYRVRNAVAHSNGQKERLSPTKWEELLEILGRTGDAEATLRRGALVVPSSYLAAAYQDVQASLMDLVQRAKATSS